MPWERRQRGGLYYCRTRRINGRRVREYLGTGVVGEIAAEEDAERAAQRQQDKVDAEGILKELEAGQAIIERFKHETQRILEAQGYYRHHRGAWRKRREAT